MTRRLLRAALSITAILLILVAAPAALWFLGRPLLPDTIPDWEQALGALSRPDDGRLLLGLLALVGATAWALLAFSLIAEIASVIARRPVLRIGLPGFRFSRGIAAGLIAALLGLGATPALAAPATAGITLTAPDHRHQPTGDPAPTGPVHTVTAHETLWQIAENELGDPLRWREIYDLNQGRPQTDGAMLTEASLLHAGWTLVLPADTRPVTPRATVAPGDTLGGIADDRLGSPDYADELFDTNRGRPQADGHTLTDPDLIRPGWILTLPAPADAPPPVDTPVSPPASPSPTPVVPAPPSPAGTPLPSTPPLPTTPAPVSPTTDPPAEPTASPGAGTSVADESSTSDDADNAVLPMALTASSLVVGGLLSALAVRRRRQRRARPAGHRIAVPPDAAGRLEWLGTRREAPAVDIAFLDAALRSLTLTDWTDHDLPHLRSVHLTPDTANLDLAADATPPEPFITGDAPTRWRLDSSTALPLPPHEAGGYCAPFPLLVSLATGSDEATLLVDLEQCGVLSLTGRFEHTDGLLRHVAAELANSRWAEDVEVLLVGFGTELVTLNPERLCTVPTLAAGLEEVRLRLRAAQASIGRLPVDSVLDGRLRDIAADAWLPVVLLAIAEPTAAELDTITELADEFATHDRLAAAVVVAADLSTATTLDISADGTLTVTDVPGGPWTAESMTEATGAGLAAILHPTDQAHPPAGPATEQHQPWAAGMNTDGSLTLTPSGTPPTPETATPSRTTVRSGHSLGPETPDTTFLADDQSVPGVPADHNGRPRPAADPTSPSLPEPTPTPDPAGAPATDPEPPAEADPEALRRLAIVEHQDPDLDDDLRRWATDTPPAIPLIAILGRPEVRAPGELPSARPGWFTEVLVYLGLHPSGVSIPKALTDLWPEGKKVSLATVRHAFYGARRWAGRGLGGDPAAAFVSDMQHDSTYRIRGHLLDWDLFRRLRKRAQARAAAHHPAAIDDYRAALDLVRGPVLSGLRHDGYAWLNNHDQRHDLQIPGFIVDAAHELVDLALTTGDTALARNAAETAHSIDIDVAFDRPLTDLMRIAHAEHNPSEMERYAETLLDARDFDVPEELPPETFAVLDDLLPHGPRRRPR